MRFPRKPAAWLLILGLALAPALVAAESTTDQARPARLRSNVELSTPLRSLVQQDTTVACFEGFLTAIISPACFIIPNEQPGDCVSTDGHFVVQYLFPSFQEPHQITDFGFLSNDGDTVFPSGGVLILPVDNQGFVRFPNANELASLQVSNIPTPADTAVVFVDLVAENLVLNPGDDVAVVVALQFPEGGELTDVAAGPGIAADGEEPDQDCDFFTIDGGASGVWYSPFHDPDDPNSIPLDWGFAIAVEPVVAVERRTWTHIKQLYRNP